MYSVVFLVPAGFAFWFCWQVKVLDDTVASCHSLLIISGCCELTLINVRASSVESVELAGVD